MPGELWWSPKPVCSDTSCVTPPWRGKPVVRRKCRKRRHLLAPSSTSLGTGLDPAEGRLWSSSQLDVTSGPPKGPTAQPSQANPKAERALYKLFVFTWSLSLLCSYFAFISGKEGKDVQTKQLTRLRTSRNSSSSFTWQKKQVPVATVCRRTALIRPGSHALLGLSSLRWAWEQVSFINHESSNAALVNTEQTQLMYHSLIVLSWSDGAFTRSHF